MKRELIAAVLSARSQATDAQHRQQRIPRVNVLPHRTFTFLSVLVLSMACFTCTPPPSPIIHTCPEPLWNTYSALDAYQVTKETARLETLLAQQESEPADSGAAVDSTDTTTAKKFSTLEIKRRLFELSIHRANPVYDVDKISGYVSYLYQHGGPDSLRYLNWGRAAREQKALIRQRDSLESAIAAIFSQGEKKENRSLENLKKEIKGYIKQCDSLTTVITTQQETIMKLQKLDVLMEQQRSKIQ